MIYSILILLFAHWMGDFALQTDEMALNKSKTNKALLLHTIAYGLIMLFAAQLLTWNNFFGKQPWHAALIFSAIQFITHTMIDYVTSRINTYYWKNDKRHEFFVMMGFDQFLHVAIILLSIHYLFLLG